SFDINNHDETIGPLTMDGGNINTDLGTLTLNGDVTRVASAVASSSAIFGKLSLCGVSRTFTINNNPRAAMDISATISDCGASAGITKTGAGLFLLENSNSYSGLTVLAAGITAITDGNALGEAGGGTVVSNGATLRLAAGINVAESAITLNGLLQNLSHTNS